MVCLSTTFSVILSTRMTFDAFAPGAAKNMNVRPAALAFKKAANQDFVSFQDYSADRTDPVPVARKAVNAAPDVHKAILAAVQGRKG